MTEYAAVNIATNFKDDVAIADRSYELYPTGFVGATVEQLDFIVASTSLGIICISPIQFSELAIAERNYEIRIPTEFSAPNIPQFKLLISSTSLGLVCISPIQFSELAIAERNYDISTPTAFIGEDTNIYSYGSTINIMERTGIMIAPNIMI